MFPENTISIPAGTEINNGPSEDSDSIVLEVPYMALVVGEIEEGALPVRIFFEPNSNEPEDMVRYWHQSSKTNPKA